MGRVLHSIKYVHYQIWQTIIDEGEEVDEEGGDGGADLWTGVEDSEGCVPDGRREDFFGEKPNPEKVDAEVKIYGKAIDLEYDNLESRISWGVCVWVGDAMS